MPRSGARMSLISWRKNVARQPTEDTRLSRSDARTSYTGFWAPPRAAPPLRVSSLRCGPLRVREHAAQERIPAS